MEKKALGVGDLLAIGSRSRIASDISNAKLREDVKRMLDDMKRERDAKKKTPGKIMHLEMDDQDAQASFNRRKNAILKAIEAIDEVQRR